MTGLAALAEENRSFSLNLFEIIGQMIHTAKLQISPCIGQALEHTLSTGQCYFLLLSLGLLRGVGLCCWS